MAYKVSHGCGGLRYNISDFTEVNKVLTSESMEVDVYTPTYSQGVNAEFDAAKYADSVGQKDTTFTATVTDSATTWSDGTATVTAEDMADCGVTEITGVVNGSTIKIAYSKEDAPRTELVGEPFLPCCGGQYFDNGVFKVITIDGKSVVTSVNTSTATTYFAANCSLLFDADVFELDEDKAIVLI